MLSMAKSNGLEKTLIPRVERQMREAFGVVFSKRHDYSRNAEEFFSEARAAEQVELVRVSLPFALEGKRLLEVGSAYGVFVRMAAERGGAETFGIEPAPAEFSGTIDGCREYLKMNGCPLRVARASGDEMPFRNGSFDVVCSYNVLEHVDGLGRVMGEAVRVLAPGGCAVMVVPNYGSWWEGHYGLLWLPHMPKWLAKIYVRLHGRDPKFIDSLNFITVKKLKRTLAPHRGEIEMLSWGGEVWKRRLLDLDIKDWASLGKLKRIVQLLHKMKIHRLVARIGARLDWQTPIVLVFRKS
jgi:SAM-dependent methyltransferase